MTEYGSSQGTVAAVGALRTTAALLRGIIDVNSQVVAPTDADLLPFMQTANRLVTQFCTGANGPSPVYDSATLADIETWLAAHFYAVRDPQATAEKAGEVSATYGHKLGMFIDSTHHGQMAKITDYNGGLARWDESLKRARSDRPGIIWLGRSDLK